MFDSNAIAALKTQVLDAVADYCNRNDCGEVGYALEDEISEVFMEWTATQLQSRLSDLLPSRMGERQQPTGGLVLTRREAQSVVVDDQMLITIDCIVGAKVRLRFNAPRDLQVFRLENWPGHKGGKDRQSDARNVARGQSSRNGHDY